MAGDTHDLEYYLERRPQAEDDSSLREWRRRGLSQFRNVPRVALEARRGRLGVLSRHEGGHGKDRTPTRRGGSGRPGGGRHQFGAWPVTAEWLSAMFDYNVAPFFQSFIEVRVEKSANRILLRPYGIYGRLTWGDWRPRKPSVHQAPRVKRSSSGWCRWAGDRGARRHGSFTKPTKVTKITKEESSWCALCAWWS